MPTSLPQRLLPVLEAIRLSPSAHNTQPWRLEVHGPDTLRLAWDPARWLDIADPAREHLIYSMGSAVEAATTVAQVHCDLREPDESAADRVIADLRLEKCSQTDPDEALLLLRSRRTNRAPFHKTELEAPLLRDLEAQAEAAGARASVLSSRSAIAGLAALTAQGAESCLRDPTYLRELLAWIRLSPREPDFDRDGFTPETLCMDPLTARVVGLLKRSARARELLPPLGMAKLMGIQAARAIRRSGALLLLSTADESLRSHIAGGRALLRIWLAATRAGVALQPVHFPISRGDLRQDTLARFGLSQESSPVTLVRLGLPTRPAPASDRLPLERICQPSEGASR